MEKIFTAKSFEEAKEMAAKAFDMDELDIRFEVIEQPVKKLFGTKGEFRVRAFCADNEKKTVPQAAEKAKSTPPAQKAAKPEQSTSSKSKQYTIVSKEDAEKFKHAVEYLENILNQLGVKDFAVDVKSNGEVTMLDITGDDLGIIIGRRGETLDSLQYLTILANNRGGTEENTRLRLTVDCNGYREKREETLEILANRTSNKVIKQGRRITLEPMNPYERRIIHSKVAEIDGVYSNSIGEEPYRKVVISAEIPKRRGGNDNRSSGGDKPRGGRPNNNDKGGGNPQGRSYKQSSGFSTSFEREYKRTPSTAPEISQDTVDIEKNTSLYGKIEL
ncbi:MAG: KH domain-containing protein [Oscillospiraceae bacterium]|nr:KH domain-containing protein [Oscillospiraceae bacterium]